MAGKDWHKEDPPLIHPKAQGPTDCILLLLGIACVVFVLVVLVL